MHSKCPGCGKPNRDSQETAYFPFCSERCRLIDLDNWLSEKNRIVSDEVTAAAPPVAAPDDNDSKH